MNSSPYRAVAVFVDELARQGVTHVCISPGSRSTPLATLAWHHPLLSTTILIDERSAGFYALGMAKATGKPVALICTSGTAAANYLPAVVEAYYARVPLLVLTGDRPPEARGLGAPQTIDQVRIYGSHVKWTQDMPVPEASDSMVAFFCTAARHGLAEALGVPRGPVHLNFPFREPLSPPPELYAAKLEGVTQSSVAFTLGEAASASQVDAIAHAIRGARRGLIVCGPQSDHALAGPLGELAAHAGLPIVADPLSQVRYGLHNRSSVIDAYDHFLRSEDVAKALQPDLVLRLGSNPTSKPLTLWLQAQDCTMIQIDEAGWNDPLLKTTQMVRAMPGPILKRVAELITAQSNSPDARATATGPWLQRWQRVNKAARKSAGEAITASEYLFEGRIFSELHTALPEDVTLFVGNSMSVRDLDAFFPTAAKQIHTLANRGANGIDGVTSTALGVAGAGGGRPVVLVLGDLSFIHDLGGLLAASQRDVPLTIVVVNNDGGGIFSFLPQSEQEKDFDTLFGTPHGLEFRHAAALFGLPYTRVQSWENFRHALRAGVDSQRVTLIEVPSDRARNRALHAEVEAAVRTRMTNTDWSESL